MGLKRIDVVIHRVLEDAWNARAPTLKATRQEEKTPQPITGREDARRAQDASLVGDEDRRLRKGG